MIVETAWSRIATVRHLTFSTASSVDTGWTGTGMGSVKVSRPSEEILLYSESGTWTPNHGQSLSFTNEYRWTLLAQTIRLEHLRLGKDRPIHLVDLVAIDDSTLESVEPYS